MRDTLFLDARGLRCPLPALRLAKAMRALIAQGEKGTRLTLLADDPAALQDIPALAAAHGWSLEAFAAEKAYGWWVGQ